MYIFMRKLRILLIRFYKFSVRVEKSIYRNDNLKNLHFET